MPDDDDFERPRPPTWEDVVRDDPDAAGEP